MGRATQRLRRLERRLELANYVLTSNMVVVHKYMRDGFKGNIYKLSDY
jgi:hypothetical protein